MLRFKLSVFVLLILFASCEMKSVRVRTTVTPEIQHLVMQGCTVTTPGGNIVRLMLLGLNEKVLVEQGLGTKFVEVCIAWHLLKVRTRTIRFEFNNSSGFILKTAGRIYKSKRTPASFVPALNHAGVIRIRFEAISNIGLLGSFDLIEKDAPAGSGWSFTNCRIARGGE